MLGPFAGGLLAISVVVLLLLGPRQEQPSFVPDARSLRVAVALGVAAALFLALSSQLPIHFGYAQFGAFIAAFLLAGTGLRPRGSRLRGLMLGIAVYLTAGMMSVLVFSDGDLRGLDPLAWLIQTVAWPGLWYLSIGEFLG